MKRVTPPAGFSSAMIALSVAGMFSALIDGTLGWEYLVHERLRRLMPRVATTGFPTGRCGR
jgi:hypothetical protein